MNQELYQNIDRRLRGELESSKDKMADVFSGANPRGLNVWELERLAYHKGQAATYENVLKIIEMESALTRLNGSQ